MTPPQDGSSPLRFEHRRTTREYATSGGNGLAMCVDTCALGCGAVEHSLSAGDLRLTITTEAAARRCTVARRVGDDVPARHGERYEIVYSTTTVLPSLQKPKTVDELATWTQHRGASNEALAAACGDSVEAAALVEMTARAFGASAADFVAAVRAVAPAHVSVALAELQC